MEFEQVRIIKGDVIDNKENKSTQESKEEKNVLKENVQDSKLIEEFIEGENAQEITKEKKTENFEDFLQILKTTEKFLSEEKFHCFLENPKLRNKKHSSTFLQELKNALRKRKSRYFVSSSGEIFTCKNYGLNLCDELQSEDVDSKVKAFDNLQDEINRSQIKVVESNEFDLTKGDSSGGKISSESGSKNFFVSLDIQINERDLQILKDIEIPKRTSALNQDDVDIILKAKSTSEGVEIEKEVEEKKSEDNVEIEYVLIGNEKVEVKKDDNAIEMKEESKGVDMKKENKYIDIKEDDEPIYVKEDNKDTDKKEGIRDINIKDEIKDTEVKKEMEAIEITKEENEIIEIKSEIEMIKINIENEGFLNGKIKSSSNSCIERAHSPLGLNEKLRYSWDSSYYMRGLSCSDYNPVYSNYNPVYSNYTSIYFNSTSPNLKSHHFSYEKWRLQSKTLTNPTVGVNRDKPPMPTPRTVSKKIDATGCAIDKGHGSLGIVNENKMDLDTKSSQSVNKTLKITVNPEPNDGGSQDGNEVKVEGSFKGI